MDEYNIRKIGFPVLIQRLYEVLNGYSRSGEEGTLTMNIIEKLETKGYFKVKTIDYIRFLTGWGLLRKVKTNKNNRKLSSLGASFILLYENGLTNSAKEVIYFAFVTSRRFQNLLLLNRILVNELRSQTEFEFSNDGIFDLIIKETSQVINKKIIPSTTKAMFDLGFLTKKSKKYIARLRNLTAQGALVALHEFVRKNYGSSSARVSFLDIFENKHFSSLLFTTDQAITKIINEGHNSRLLHIEKKANINQFYFLHDDLIELTKMLLKGEII